MKPVDKYGIVKPGLAVDIDEVLSWTTGDWTEMMQTKFGNPENLSVREMVKKYRYTQNVPYWQHAEALRWTEEQIYSSEAYSGLSLIEGSDLYLNKINDIVPVAAYITIWPENVSEGTLAWFKKHNFPAAPFIFKPAGIAHGDGNKWKAQLLNDLWPDILGIIDDNVKLPQALGKAYPGRVFLYDHGDNLGLNNVIACPDWLAVYEAIKKYFYKAKK